MTFKAAESLCAILGIEFRAPNTRGCWNHSRKAAGYLAKSPVNPRAYWNCKACAVEYRDKWGWKIIGLE